MTEQEFQTQVDTLKVRVFDLSETIQGLIAQRTQYENTLQSLIQISGVAIGEDGQVKLEDLVATIAEKFAPAVDEADEESE